MTENKTPTDSCPSPQHPQDETIWCGCRHPEFWQWNPNHPNSSAGGWGWVSVQYWQLVGAIKAFTRKKE